MWEKIRVMFTIPELRQKILLTLLFLAIYRVGWQVSLPMVNQENDAADVQIAAVRPGLRSFRRRRCSAPAI